MWTLDIYLEKSVMLTYQICFGVFMLPCCAGHVAHSNFPVRHAVQSTDTWGHTSGSRGWNLLLHLPRV